MFGNEFTVSVPRHAFEAATKLADWLGTSAAVILERSYQAANIDYKVVGSGRYVNGSDEEYEFELYVVERMQL